VGDRSVHHGTMNSHTTCCSNGSEWLLERSKYVCTSN